MRSETFVSGVFCLAARSREVPSESKIIIIIIYSSRLEFTSGETMLPIPRSHISMFFFKYRILGHFLFECSSLSDSSQKVAHVIVLGE